MPAKPVVAARVVSPPQLANEIHLPACPAAEAIENPHPTSLRRWMANTPPHGPKTSQQNRSLIDTTEKLCTWRDKDTTRQHRRNMIERESCVCANAGKAGRGRTCRQPPSLLTKFLCLPARLLRRVSKSSSHGPAAADGQILTPRTANVQLPHCERHSP